MFEQVGVFEQVSRDRMVVEFTGSQAGTEPLTWGQKAILRDTALLLADLWTDWPLTRFDFTRDWPLRMAVVRHRGACLHMAWVLSHLAADGGGHVR